MRGANAPQQMVQDMVHAWAQKKSAAGVMPFAIDGEQLRPDEVAKPRGLLPLVLWHAEGLQRFALQSELGVGVVNIASPGALLTVEARFDKPTRPMSETLCYVLEALEDMAQNMPRATNSKSAELRSLVNTFASSIPTLTASQEAVSRPAR